MSTYKVIQDIEAEDKLIWVFSFRQFVYLLISVLFLYISFLFFIKHVVFMDVLTLPIVIFSGILAYPFGQDQPTEVWVLAKIRFFVKPRKRIWSQSGTKELVTINVPKKVQVDLTDGLSQTEVRSRLETLAKTIDTRGWSIKNASNPYVNSVNSTSSGSDRLINPIIVQSNDDVDPSDDILDSDYNPLAQKMTEMITENDEQRRQRLMSKLNAIKRTSPQDQSQPSPAPNATATKKIIDRLKEKEDDQKLSLNNLRSISKNRIVQGELLQQTPGPVSVKPKNPDIINPSKRNDLNLTVISHEAGKNQTLKNQPQDNETVISLR